MGIRRFNFCRSLCGHKTERSSVQIRACLLRAVITTHQRLKKKKKKRARVWSLPQWVHILLGFGNQAGAEMRGTARCQNTHNISCSCHVIRVRIKITLSSPSAVTVRGEKLTAEVTYCGFHSKFDLNSFYRSTALSTNLIFIHDVFFFLAVVMHHYNDHWIT